MNRPASLRNQHGAALAIALLMLVIITLLGVAAVRATQVELRLSQNSESRMSAQQAAQTMLGYLMSTANVSSNLPANDNVSFRVCLVGGSVVASNLPFTCGATDSAATLGSLPINLSQYGYVESKREQPLFVEVNVDRDALSSARNYDFARYTITGGYDNTLNGMSAAEVTESRLVLHVKTNGVTYQ